MYQITYDELKDLIQGLKDSSIDNPSEPIEFRINVLSRSTIILLEDIEENAKTISWYTGYSPKVFLDEDIVENLKEHKNYLEKHHA